jgi:hypothetical protein
MITVITALILAFAAIALTAVIWTFLSIHRANVKKAYYAGIEEAEKKQFERVYGKYVNA